jgi:hypothetical protein
MKSFKKGMIKFYFFTIERFFECAKLYKISLGNLAEEIPERQSNDFEFYLPDKRDIKLFKKLLNTENEKKANRINSILDNKNYKCFAYRDKTTGDLIYTRWLCIKTYYSNVLQEELHFDTKEALTLDSYTHPDYRFKGLHFKMNIQMLKWVKDNTEIETVYMVIKCFLPHLTKIPLQLGYRPIKTFFHYKKGSIPFYLNLIQKKYLGSE